MTNSRLFLIGCPLSVRLVQAGMAFVALSISHVAWTSSSEGTSSASRHWAPVKGTYAKAPTVAAFPSKATRLDKPEQAASVRIVLPPVAKAKVEQAQERAGGPLRIGAHRLPPAEGDLSPRILWRTIADGKAVGVFTVESPNARFIRLGLSIDLPAGGELRFFSPRNASETYPSVRSFEVPDGDTPLWTPTVEGDVIGVEVTLSSIEDVSRLRLEVWRIVHRWASATTDDARLSANALNCPGRHIDAACSPLVQDVGSAVAKIEYEKVGTGGSYMCTGTLLATDDARSNDVPPYLLTAQHCIGNAHDAETIETIWFHQSAGCNGPNLDRRRITVSGGAQFLVASAEQDAVLVKLRGNLPEDVYFAGWDPSELPMGTPVFAFHHPDGTRKRYAEGTVYGIEDARVGDNVVRSAIIASWERGTTEPGSSGAALIRAGQYVVGALSGGPECINNISAFGNFSSFYPKIAKWLRPNDAVAAAADVSVDLPQTATDSLRPNRAFTLSVAVHNLGNAQAPSTPIWFYRSADGRIDRTEDISIASDTMPRLNASSTITVSKRITAPSEQGVHYFGACAEAVSGERNTANNCSSGIPVNVASGSTSPIGESRFDLPLLWDARDQDQQGFVRIRSLADRPIRVAMYAFNSGGRRHGPIEVDLGAYQVRHLNTDDLYYGNPDKDIAHGFSADGLLRLRMESPAALDVTSYNRTPGGFLTSMLPAALNFNSGVQDKPWGSYVPTFNPGGNSQQVSYLYIANPNATPVRLTITAEDDAGVPGAYSCGPTDPNHLPPHASLLYSAQELEENCFGDGRGKWTVFVVSDRRLDVMSLLYSVPSRLWTNLTARGPLEQAVLNGMLAPAIPQSLNAALNSNRGVAMRQMKLPLPPIRPLPPKQSERP